MGRRGQSSSEELLRAHKANEAQNTQKSGQRKGPEKVTESKSGQEKDVRRLEYAKRGWKSIQNGSKRIMAW